MPPTLTALLIVKDEDAHLARCLRSVESIADELVVVDTGSSDNTVAIARDFGAVVEFFPWTGDFAAARNVSLSHATGTWILWLDADEWVATVDSEQLSDELADDSVFARLVSLRPRRESVPYRELRLFRNHPELSFHGTLHADLSQSIESIIAGTALRVDVSHLSLDHDGYDGDQAAKNDDRRPMLEAATRNEPDLVRNWLDLGRFLVEEGEDERGIEAYRQGLAAARRGTHSKPGDALLYCELASALRDGRASPTDLGFGSVVDDGLHRFGPVPGLRLLDAQRAIDEGHPTDAIPLLESLVETDVDSYIDPGVSWDLRLFGEWPWAMLGSCFFALGQYEEAAAAYAEAVRHNPSIEHRAKEAAARQRARRVRD